MRRPKSKPKKKKSDRRQAKSNFSENTDTASNSTANIPTSGKRTRPIDPRYGNYVSLKRAYLRQHPNASNAELDVAARRIAKRLRA